jgi:hypothetical protein
VKIVKTHSETEKNVNQPTVSIREIEALIVCDPSCGEGQFSIADELGRIVKKGVLITGENIISFQGIKAGFYHLIIFNESDRFMHPLRIN